LVTGNLTREITAIAQTEDITTQVSPRVGVMSSIHKPKIGPKAVLRASIVLKQDGVHYTGHGNITFGGEPHIPSNHVLFFESINTGAINRRNDQSIFGADMFRITRGRGAFAGARGLLTSNWLNNATYFTDNQIGHFYISK